MANYCSNSVVFSGPEDKLQSIFSLFEEIEKNQEASGKYYMPSFMKEEGGYMSDIAVVKPRVLFETRWGPNLGTLCEFADHYGLSYVSKYSELMMGVFGEARYEDGTLSVLDLAGDDYKKLKEMHRIANKTCPDNLFEVEGAMLDFLLEQKRDGLEGPKIYTVTR